MRLAGLTSALLLAAACTTTPAPVPAVSPPEREFAEPETERSCLTFLTLKEPGPARDEAFADIEQVMLTYILLSMPNCLDSPDPVIRDGYAFEILSLILRAGDQSEETVRTLMTRLLADLASAGEDKNGFRGPFAALALAEVARVDRITPFLSEEDRWDLLMAAKTYLGGLTDYRGYSSTEGWRHGVAHTADLLMQMSLNSHLTKPQAEEILAAVATKVGTPDHAYIFGESERLAAPITYLAFKETFTAEEWAAWFQSLWPADDPLRETAYRSEAALTKLHNLRAFAQSVYVNAVASNDDRMKPVAGAAFQFLNQLP
ncbi:MAG: DUF2785 domain-containing protein [Hyphomonas sp.]